MLETYDCENSFNGCVALKGVTFPSTIKEIGAGALAMNTDLTTVKFTPGDITVKIGDSLFTQCYALTDLTLPTLMDRVSAQMFFNSRLTYLFIPNGVTSIGDGAFQRTYITTLVIPSTITEIGLQALGPNSNFQYIYFCGTQS